MSVHAFCLDTVKHLEAGAVQRAFDDEVARAVRDCSQRPTETRVRKVILQAEFVPSSSADGSIDDLEVTVQVQAKIPAVATRAIVMALRKKGNQLMLAFDDESGEEDAA